LINIKNWIGSNIVYLTPAGSQLYGTNTPESDMDYRGATIPPKEYFYGFGNFEQTDSKEVIPLVAKGTRRDLVPDSDIVIWSLKKMIGLAADGNPNMLELLFVPEDSIIYAHPLMERFSKIKDAFLSKLLKHRFSGYAMQQLKRMRNHHRWTSNPPTYPTRADYGIEGMKFPKDQLHGALKMIELQVGEWLVDQTHLTEDTKIQLGPEMVRMVNVVTEQLYIEANVDHLKDVLERAANRTLGFDSDFVNYLQRYSAYKNHLEDWNHYEKWKQERNPKRSELEQKHGFDCYLSDTEFLTDTGWKLYREISENDKLGTINTEGNLEYQHFLGRDSYRASGFLYEIRMQQSNCVVTSNHRLLVTRTHRQKSNNFTIKYNPEQADWALISVDKIEKSRYGSFHARLTCNPREDYPIPNEKLRLIGVYIAEGSIIFYKNKAKSLNISQHPASPLIPWLENLRECYGAKRYYYERTLKSGRITKECVYSFSAQLADEIYGLCGKAKNKHLPHFKDKLNERQARLMLEGLIGGDGTYRKFSSIYYTSLKRLADDVQIMCLQAGIVSQVWGPYYYDRKPREFGNCAMYQVYIGKTRTCAYLSKSQHIHPVRVKNGHVVCFTVPNEVLITRRKGKIAIHGNSKHALHLVRLMRMAREILEGKGVIVRRPDAEELLAIRNGAWKYEELIEWAEKEDKALNEVMDKSSLPKSPNRKLINRVLVEEIDRYLSGTKEKAN